MAQPTYYDLAGNVVEFYHPIDALEALEQGAITTKKGNINHAAKVEAAPVVEEVKEEVPVVEEEVDEAPKKKAPRRRSAE
jgi:hypothetical protein